jgi:hypothetical protein
MLNSKDQLWPTSKYYPRNWRKPWKASGMEQASGLRFQHEISKIYDCSLNQTRDDIEGKSPQIL